MEGRTLGVGVASSPGDAARLHPHAPAAPGAATRLAPGVPRRSVPPLASWFGEPRRLRNKTARSCLFAARVNFGTMQFPPG